MKEKNTTRCLVLESPHPLNFWWLNLLLLLGWLNLLGWLLGSTFSISGGSTFSISAYGSPSPSLVAQPSPSPHMAQPSPSLAQTSPSPQVAQTFPLVAQTSPSPQVAQSFPSPLSIILPARMGNQESRPKLCISFKSHDQSLPEWYFPFPKITMNNEMMTINTWNKKQ